VAVRHRDGRRREVTREEQAAFKRLNKRRDSLFSALCVIKTWIAFPDDGATLYHIAKLATERIEEERAAMAREGGGK
jgi:hypothetical protein